MKKLAIVGKGTAGVIAAAHFAKQTDYVIDIYYDPSITLLESAHNRMEFMG